MINRPILNQRCRKRMNAAIVNARAKKLNPIQGAK